MKPVECPICEKAMPGARAEYPDAPFCSRRCRLVDLGRWLGEDYRVAGKEVTDDRSTAGDPADDR